ncbi:MAG: peptidase S8 and S53 subtilisin kexin sedolisin [Methylibium sp.]|nr:peptidase S8 and S53 subtilisin kexin sedolisin [Methylibium sp.]
MNLSIRLAVASMLAAGLLGAQAQTASRKGYVIELVDAPVASYNGSVAGLAATAPVAGAKINVNASHVQAYLSYLNSKVANVASTIPSAPIYYRYGVAFSGFAAQLTDAELQKLTTHSGVRAITRDEPRPLDTASTHRFLSLSTPGGAWSGLDIGGRRIKGEDVIIANVDSGVWPENPSFSDKIDAITQKPVPYHANGVQVYGPPPAKWKGSCQAGLGFTSAMCNNKLIGAQYFNTGWKQSGNATWPLEYLDSPRDEDGHGSHTLATAGGNENTDVVVGGTPISGVSGVAPRARVAAYKVCYTNQETSGARGRGGCFPSDSVAAINKAVADGVDVINFSVSGSQTSFRDAVETAFLNAAKAGVFVSASAGNGNVNGASTVAHNSPWLLTVGNSTHDRYTEAQVFLGSNGTVQGSSFQTLGLPAKALIWSRNAGFGAAAGLGSAQALCFGAVDGQPALLDPAKVSGKILVCDRGTNALVNKVVNAKAAGAVGVIIVNTSSANNSTPLISAELPTVHVPVSAFASVTAEASSPSGSAAFGGGVQVAGAIAPVMSGSSSRGPNQADLNVLKPDLTAPGTDIIAAYSNRSINAAQRAGIIAGTLIPDAGADMISGTSMSSPHTAGAAALLRQANPSWSPYAIKSALMTSTQQIVKLASGAPDTVRWGYGAGHMTPAAALSTKVVYDQSNADHDAYYAGVKDGSTLNLASLTRANVVGVYTFTRTLTNKGTASRSYSANASVPGFDVTVSPSNFSLAPGASQSISVTVLRTTATIGSWVNGSLTWTGDDGSTLYSPITVRAQSLVALATVTDTRAAGTKVFSISTGFGGSFYTTGVGLVASTRFSGSVATNGQQCLDFAVPSGAKLVRAQLRNVDTQGGSASDLDVSVYRDGVSQGSSFNGDSNELVQLSNPGAGSYSACVEGYAPLGGNASFVLNVWVLPGTGAPHALNAFGPSTVKTGGIASVGMSWNVPTGAWYLGMIEYRNAVGATPLGNTTVLIDNGPSGAPAMAPVTGIKPAR